MLYNILSLVVNFCICLISEHLAFGQHSLFWGSADKMQKFSETKQIKNLSSNSLNVLYIMLVKGSSLGTMMEVKCRGEGKGDGGGGGDVCFYDFVL